MNKYIKKINRLLILFGVDLKKIFKSIYFLPGFIKDFLLFLKSEANKQFDINLYPILFDNNKNAGIASGHYFHQDLLIAKKIYNANPKNHFDIGSRIDGFISHLAVFRSVTVIDIRELTINIDNIKFLKMDIMNIKKDMYEICDSISCLHALEHFGLGRYGDPINSNGHIVGFQNISKLLKINGVLYISVPIGPQRVEFNAHRVFSIKYLINLFQKKYKILSFSYVDDHGSLHKNISIDDKKSLSNFGCYYGCGIFELKKIKK